MSLDYYLYKNLNEVLTEPEVRENLSQDYKILDLQIGPDDEVIYFIVEPNDNPQNMFDGGLEISLQDDGKYWMNTYDYDDNHFRTFLEVVADIAERLDFVIEDFQVGDSDIDPKTFLNNKERITFAKMQRDLTDEFPDILKLPEE